MKTTKILFTFLLILVFSLKNAAAEGITTDSNAPRKAIYEGENYGINLSYTDKVKPGDAVFIRMKFTTAKGTKKSKDGRSKAKAALSGKKRSVQADFFNISPSKKSAAGAEFFAGLPLSSRAEAGEYTLTVTYSPFGMEIQEFTLPVTVEAKKFTEEVIPLSGKNTQLRQDTSPERMEQIAKLNKIFDTIDENSVYSLEKFILPVSSERRTAGFADRRIYEYSTGKTSETLHNGIDFGVREGTEVLACAEGKIVLAENRITTGFSVVIEHLPGLYSVYYHLSALNVKENQIVKKGERIGLSGATGMVTGPHLHWEVRLNSIAVNPDIFLQNFSFEGKN
ncbi:M23 family metallopeptidase [Treponema parvum]|uniref:M23 family metallopeptidase n=1 Tax=Treponema parvum TaxID=138851 RepID=UPI001AEBFD83|nr:M23 family metallopeptidase [Treponema parvum]QTQ16380.1 M23 family metallopeptidase [Treponema parvum]